METLIKLSGISKVFRTQEVETHALANVDLTIGKGEFISIVGPSGCGKSTLLSILGLLDSPTAGQYTFNERDVSKLSDNEMADTRNTEIGFVFQSFNLIGDLTVMENVELPLIYRGLGRKETKARVEAVLNKLGMAERRSHYPRQLSGGQQQRVSLARALVGEPKVLLADEPAGNLDSSNGQMVIELLQQIHEEGATICMVTHNDHHAEMADRAVLLNDGKVCENTTFAEMGAGV